MQKIFFNSYIFFSIFLITHSFDWEFEIENVTQQINSENISNISNITNIANVTNVTNLTNITNITNITNANMSNPSNTSKLENTSNMTFAPPTIATPTPIDYTNLNYPLMEWDKLPSLDQTSGPGPRRGFSSFSIDNLLYVFGGCKYDSACFNDLFVFKIRTLEWKRIPAKGSMPTPREGSVSVVVGDQIYFFGGNTQAGCSNQLYLLDLPTFVWIEPMIKGTVPKGRTNCKASLDNNGVIYFFGGYTDDGYSNEIFALDTIKKIWFWPDFDGKPPSPRESFSMSILSDKLWIFGGFALGGVKNDLFALDLVANIWSKPLTSGYSPSPRQGHTMLRQGKFIYLFGGCDYKKTFCYNDSYILNSETMYWTKLDPRSGKYSGRQGHAVLAYGGLFFLYGGCKFYGSCTDDYYIMKTPEECPSNCFLNGVCRNKRCNCFVGFAENDCHIQMKCKDNCLGKGRCSSEARCACYGGYYGESCENTANCPKNCTSAQNGVCLRDDKCKCKTNWTGLACEIANCQNNCSGHGVCDKEYKTCFCYENWFGLDCSQSATKRIPTILKIPLITKTVKASKKYASPISKRERGERRKEAPKNITKKPPKSVVEPPKNITNVNNEVIIPNISNVTNVTNVTNTTNTTNITNITIEAPPPPPLPTPLPPEEKITVLVDEPEENENLTVLRKTTKTYKALYNLNHSLIHEMFGLANHDEFIRNSEKPLDHIECPNRCSFNGICHKKGYCLCRQGSFTEDCSVTNLEEYLSGELLTTVIFFALIFYGIGFFVGIIVLLYLIEKNEEAEFMEIQREDDED